MQEVIVCRKATLMSVRLNSFVVKVTSLAVYVKVAHLRLAGWYSGCEEGGEEKGEGSLGGYREVVVAYYVMDDILLALVLCSE